MFAFNYEVRCLLGAKRAEQVKRRNGLRRKSSPACRGARFTRSRVVFVAWLVGRDQLLELASVDLSQSSIRLGRIGVSVVPRNLNCVVERLNRDS